MKNYTLPSLNRFSYLLFFLLGSLSFLTSCEEEDPTRPLDAAAPPVIEAVRSTRPDKPDSTFTQSTLGSTIVIVGKNLAATQYVVFNGLKTSINPVYATDTHLIVRIPDLVPTVATAATVPDELVVVNSKGEAKYTFKVLPPAPTVAGISNEYAKAGQTITLFGNYFYFVKEVIFPGDISVATGITATPNGEKLTVTVPAGVDGTKGDVIVVSESGKSGISRRTKMYSGTGIIHNWDEVNAFGWGLDAGKKVTDTYPGFTAIENKFGVVDQVVPGGWGWNNDKVISMSNNTTKRLIPAIAAPKYGADTPINNFDLKMEIAASGSDPLEGLELLVWIPGTPVGTVEKSFALVNYVRSTDGTWYTFSVPLADLATSGGAKMTKYGDLNPNEIRLVVQNPTAAGKPVKLAFDNFRIENMVIR